MLALAVVVAGCGGATRPPHSGVHELPPALAQDWEGRASAIATAASTGDSCRAMQLADSLRDDVLAQEHKLPLRLRSPLVTGVIALAGRPHVYADGDHGHHSGAAAHGPPHKPHHPPAHGHPGRGQDHGGDDG